ncbi:sensor histidine kinase [Halosimplex halobium]|uniref:sensor histidine kinase n=1 Tax=Halosimplex halobium TaxID=3396618 RepID=UPI003F576A5F
MGSDPEASGQDGPATVSIDAFPDPVFGYEHREERPVITQWNDAFERAFAGVSTGTPVRDWLLTETDADDKTVERICSALDDEAPFDSAVTVGRTDGGTTTTEEYRLRTLDGAGSEGEGAEGYLVATATGSPESSGVEVDRIASIISHDLRNPLDVANAHLRAARNSGDEEHFDQVDQAHDRMERIVRDVLTLARGKHVLNVTPEVDVEAVARDAWATVETGPASLAVGDDLPETDADPDRLQRLFENLFRNAVEHAQDPEEENTTGVGGRDESSASRGVEVTVGRTDGGFFVADDGVGIPTDERERVFEPGYSASGTNNGTGLGLTIVERIAEAHDWTVSLATGSAGGARFEFQPSSDGD